MNGCIYFITIIFNWPIKLLPLTLLKSCAICFFYDNTRTLQCVSWTKINCGRQHCYCTLYATQAQSLSLSLNLPLPHTHPLWRQHSRFITCEISRPILHFRTAPIHTLSLHPHNHNTHTLFSPPHCYHPCHWLLLSYRPPPSFFAANTSFAITTGFDRYPIL